MIAKQYNQPQLASQVYRIVFPVTLFALTPWVAAIVQGDPLNSLMYPMLIVMAGVMLPLWAVYSLLLRNSERQQRVLITFVVGCVLTTGALFLLRGRASETVMQCVYAGLITCLICTGIHRIQPISPHIALVSGSAIVAILSSATAGAIILPLALLSNWSVLETNKATVRETMGTWSIITVVTVIVFAVFEMLQ